MHRTPSLLLILFALAPDVPRPASGLKTEGRVGLDIVHPVRVDAGGSFLSYELWPRALRKRDVSATQASSAFYQLQYQGRELFFNLTTNPYLLAPGFVSEIRRHSNLSHVHIRTHAPTCHLLGDVQDPELEGGFAAISTCDGLRGVFQLSNEEYFIEPLDGVPAQPGQAKPHVVYKHQDPGQRAWQGGSRAPSTCEVQVSPELERQQELWAQQQQQKRRQQRSVSKEKWVEALVVADAKMVEYHGQPQVETYVLTVMNMVAGLFRDPSVGNAIYITIVRLILLENDEKDLKITHHADNTLRNFCKWQKDINMRGDAHPQHHDTAILLTRKDLCAARNQPCETLGMSHVAGMCHPQLSCSVNEDTGLPLAFTVAHELGHSFGIQHDGNGNECESVGKRPYIMSPQLLYDKGIPLTWSRCSREYITRFLDRGWGFCLDDTPAKDVIDLPSVLPGVLYDVNHQCRLQYGPSSVFCEGMDNVCHTLWCSVGTTCQSKMDAAVDGTRCGKDKWCLNGECVPEGFQPEAVDGGWSGWSAWSACSRSCGVGAQSAERQCTQPVPKHRGKYCVGERKRFRLCNLPACPAGQPSFRHTQCSQFDGKPYKGQLHKWVPVIHDENPCELRCRPSNYSNTEKLRDAVVDGTPCYQGRVSRDICINGICKNVGCDYEIDSGAMEDRCGVCRGNGSTCHTVSRTFRKAEGTGYVNVGLIPAGAREILIKEVAEAANFLALRSVKDPNKYFLNGDWTIQWNGDYQVAGTTFTYVRLGNLENLTSPGPTTEPVWIQLLFQERNPGVHYEYTIQRDSYHEVQSPEFSWRYGPWSKCTVTCGTGVQRQSLYCMERQAGIVDEKHCGHMNRPNDRQRKCNDVPCPARWWAGEWYPCSHSCGPSGFSRRPVLCIQSVGLDEQRALESRACQHLPRPLAETPCNRHVPCPSKWGVGNWSQCSVTCGVGIRQRNALCINDTTVPCVETERPTTKATCFLPPCRQTVHIIYTEGSGSGSSSPELFNEVDFIPHRQAPRPSPASSPKPVSISNAIGEADLEPDRPGPALVDDFYYDYNFINFHEDLSYGPFEESHPDLIDTGNWIVPSPIRPTGSPSQTPVPTAGTPGAREEEVQGAWSPRPSLSQASHSPSVFIEQTPGSPLANFVSEEDAPIGGPELELPGLSWTPPSADDMVTPVAPENPDELLLREEEQGQPPTPRSDRNMVSKDENTLGHTSPPLPKIPSLAQPSSPSISTTHASPSPNMGEVWTEGTVASDPVVEDDLKPVHEELGPTVEATPSLPPPVATVPGILGRDSPLELGIPTFSTPGLGSQNPKTLALPGTFLLTEPTDLRSREPLDQPQPPNPEGTLSPGLLPGLIQETQNNSSKDAEVQPLQPSLVEDGFPADSLPAKNASWQVGNWSQCSTTCGLGATWRLVRCSTGTDEDCILSSRPQPARHCHLRPCAAWRTGNWSKCSRNCGGGSSTRDVQCVDTRDLRPLRPFHCQPGPTKPPTRQLCGTQACLSWYTSSWRECSEACGGGEQQRLVTCPEPGLCEELLRPNSTRPCNTHPCTQWVVGPWGQCSAPCGGGVQRRLVKCVNTQTGLAEEDSDQCSHEAWPESSRPCATEDCELVESTSCERDRLSFSFCETLRLLGRCQLPTIRAQCCRSCPPLSRSAPSRGYQLVARR
ncbi:A disintegrin and metalloproteinase with thrombospondin motifs 7 [Acomys russatus]|uniref:A disintegrin and metalloproteinase with thrombospondin motifs 7 n=1 Tax=Acomys russatus TaxID=60746 RepID=UPI0021E20B2A|nr:A disintegrin and metalloproteinase with thrombospondin motifs 7 [Acomys russatus]